jgi:DNA repair protein RecO (recombination protein O)
MDLRAERLHALVLRRIPFGDSDLVLHLLTRERGRVAAYARAARKSRRRFPAFEPFQLCEVLVGGASGSGLAPLREASLVEPHAALQADLHRLAHASYGCELAWSLAREGQSAEPLFDGLLRFFGLLGGGVATSSRLRAFELAALEAAGFAPELGACARCGEEPPAHGAWFDAEAGGLCCRTCASGSARQLSRAPWAALSQLQRRGLTGAEEPQSADGSGRAAQRPAFEAAAALAGPLLASFLAHQLGKQLRARDFLEEVGAPQ